MKGIFQDHLKELSIFLFPDGAVYPEMVARTRILAGDVSGRAKWIFSIQYRLQIKYSRSNFKSISLKFIW